MNGEMIRFRDTCSTLTQNMIAHEVGAFSGGFPNTIDLSYNRNLGPSLKDDDDAYSLSEVEDLEDLGVLVARFSDDCDIDAESLLSFDMS